VKAPDPHWIALTHPHCRNVMCPAAKACFSACQDGNDKDKYLRVTALC
jgi:hypothetical protein